MNDKEVNPWILIFLFIVVLFVIYMMFFQIGPNLVDAFSNIDLKLPEQLKDYCEKQNGTYLSPTFTETHSCIVGNTKYELHKINDEIKLVN